MNEATNDATEFESSLDGAIGFFQNLRRKLGTLEQDASTQHDRLHAIAVSVADLERDRQIDRQTFATLVGGLDAQAAQLTDLQADGRLLEEQLGAIEALVGCFQQSQEQLRQQFATLTGDLQAQNADLRQDLDSALEQRAVPLDQIVSLETQLAQQARDLRDLLASVQLLSQDTLNIRDHSAGHDAHLEQHQGRIAGLEAAVQASQEQLGQFSNLAETQHQHLHRLENALGAIDQNARSLGQVVDNLKTTLDRHDPTLESLHQIAEAQETTRRQHDEQQERLDGFAESLDARRQESHNLHQSLARLQDEFETQRQTLSDADQTRQDLLKQQDRLKHLETLIGKISADTHSTRQILNILQSDLITQSDTLREIDQHWQGILATHQPSAHPPETPAAEACRATAAPEECVGSPSAPSASSPNAAFDKPLAVLALESERLERELQQVLSEVQNGLMGQDERFTELRSAFQERLNRQQERLAQLETALDQLREIPATAPDLDPLRDTLAAQAEALRELRETAQQQAATLAQTLELQQSDVRETSATVADLQQEFGELRQTLTGLNATIEQQHQRAEAGHRQELDLQREQASLQRTLTVLEERLSSQALAFSGHFEQFQTLASDIRNLQQQISTLEAAPQRLNALEEDRVGWQQSIARLQDTVRQLQEDSQQAGEALQQINPSGFVGDLEARLNEQHQQFNQLNEEIEAIRGDAKATQEKVITMATNVAKRIFEFQNQLTATETAHAGRLQEAEQKLIQLQAALEIMETQRKGRRWLSMPAMFSHLLVTVGATFLGILATVIWTTT